MFLQEDPNLNEKYLHGPRVVLQALTLGGAPWRDPRVGPTPLCERPEHYFDITNFDFDQIVSHNLSVTILVAGYHFKCSTTHLSH